MGGANASGAVKIKVGACDREAMLPPTAPMARGGVINILHLAADFAGGSIKTFPASAVDDAKPVSAAPSSAVYVRFSPHARLGQCR
jgi:hypothetical protein